MSEFTNSPEQLKKIATAVGVIDIQYHPDNNNLIYPKDPSNGDFTVVCYNPKENAKQLVVIIEYLLSKDYMLNKDQDDYVLSPPDGDATNEIYKETLADAVLTAMWEIVN